MNGFRAWFWVFLPKLVALVYVRSLHDKCMTLSKRTCKIQLSFWSKNYSWTLRKNKVLSNQKPITLINPSNFVFLFLSTTFNQQKRNVLLKSFNKLPPVINLGRQHTAAVGPRPVSLVSCGSFTGAMNLAGKLRTNPRKAPRAARVGGS